MGLRAQVAPGVMASKSPTPRMLLTRPQSASERLLAQIDNRGLPTEDAVISPAVKIVPVGAPIEVAGDSTAIFTSGFAVEQALALPGAKAFCVGEQTASRAREAGFDATAGGGTVQELIETLTRASVDRPLIYLRGMHIRHDLCAELAARGIKAEDRIVYDQLALAPNAAAIDLLEGTSPIVLPLFSPRSARLVKGWISSASPSLTAVCLSDAVAKAWEGPALVSEYPDSARLLDRLAEVYATLGNG